jgi:hypothetical protein
LVVHELAPLREAIYAEPETNVAAYRVLVAWMRAPSLDAVPLVASELERRDRVTLTKIAAL